MHAGRIGLYYGVSEGLGFKQGMRALTFTSLFPNSEDPVLGIFICQRMAHFARRAGNQVVVVAPVPYFPTWIGRTRWASFARIPTQETIGGLRVHHPRYLLVPRVSMPLHGLLMFFGSLPTLLRVRRSEYPDCIDAHYVFPDGMAAVLAGKLLGIPAFVSARGTDINLFPRFPLVRTMIRWTLSRATGIIAVCGALKEAMVDLGIPAEKIMVIGNGIDTGRFECLDRQEARRKVQIPREGRVVVAVGALIPRKGYQFLIPAMAKVLRDRADVCLYIVGEGSFRSSLEKLVIDHGLAERVHLVGSRPNEEVALWFNAADVSCLASSREGWPNVLLESLACGTPVVATRVWGVPEVITSPDLGLIVDQEPSSIARGLMSALEKPWDRDLLVRYARTRTWDVVAEEVEQYLNSRLRTSKALESKSIGTQTTPIQ